MSEQQVLEGVRANTAAMNTQKMAEYTDTFAEDAVWEDDALPGPVIGRSAAAETMGVFYKALPDLHFELGGGSLAAIWPRLAGG